MAMPRHNERVAIPPEPSTGSFPTFAPASTAVSGGPGSPSSLRKPSAAGYWIAGVVAMVGVVASVIWFAVVISGIIGAADGYPHFSLPGSRSVELDAETYKIFVEYPGANLDINQSGEVDGLTVVDSEGQHVLVSRALISETYSWGGRDGRAIAQFTAPRQGTYTISAMRSPQGSLPSGVQMAVGRGINLSVAGPLLASMALGGLSVVVSVVLIIVTAVRRGRWKRLQRPPPMMGGYPGPSGPYAYGAPSTGGWGTYPGPTGPPAPFGQSGGPSVPPPSWQPPGTPISPAPPGSWGSPSASPVSSPNHPTDPPGHPAHPPGWGAAPGVAPPVDQEDGPGAT